MTSRILNACSPDNDGDKSGKHLIIHVRGSEFVLIRPERRRLLKICGVYKSFILNTDGNTIWAGGWPEFCVFAVLKLDECIKYRVD